MSTQLRLNRFTKWQSVTGTSIVAILRTSWWIWGPHRFRNTTRYLDPRIYPEVRQEINDLLKFDKLPGLVTDGRTRVEEQSDIRCLAD